jgi:hypothetical protein
VPIGGPGLTSGPGFAEREVRGEAFNEEFKKTEIDKRKRNFLEKGFSTPIKSRKINGISTKATLSDFDFLNHLLVILSIKEDLFIIVL